VTEQKPWEILNPYDALVEAAKLNSHAVAMFEDARRDTALIAATIAQSLSTYALASYGREFTP
jgi:hypothetical protein